MSLLDLLGGRPFNHVSIHLSEWVPEWHEPTAWQMTVWRLTGKWHGEPAPKRERCFWNACGQITMHPNVFRELKTERDRRAKQSVALSRIESAG